MAPGLVVIRGGVDALAQDAAGVAAVDVKPVGEDGLGLVGLGAVVHEEHPGTAISANIILVGANGRYSVKGFVY